jgi:exodeoxyribonuclease VII large subunit
VITDFVADLRAPTPSAAMQMILPDRNEVLMQLDALMQRYDDLVENRLGEAQQRVGHLFERYRQHSVEQRLKEQRETVEQLWQRFDQSIVHRLQQAEAALQQMPSRLEQAETMQLGRKGAVLEQLWQSFRAADPARKDKKGFAQIVRDGRPVALENLHVGDRIKVMDSRHSVLAEVREISKIDTKG